MLLECGVRYNHTDLNGVILNVTFSHLLKCSAMTNKIYG